MKNMLYVFLFLLLSCNNKLYKEYKLYQRDRTINYPNEKLNIKLINDTIGLFINEGSRQGVFKQSFVYKSVISDKPDFIIIKNVDLLKPNLISLKPGDTILIDKKRLHFFYNGYKKFFLSFK